MSKPKEIVAGAVFEHKYPMLRTEYDAWDEEGPFKAESWKPGTECVQESQFDFINYANGEGAQILTVISLHQPSPKYKTRVFYTRQWRSPDGKVFGNTALRCCGMQAFRTLIAGFRYEYVIHEKKVDSVAK